MLTAFCDSQKSRRNPIEKLEDLPIKESRKRVLFDDEQQRLFDIIKRKGYKDLGDTIITRLCTAMRQGEVFNLAWENINLENRIMKIYRQKTKNWTTLYILDPLYKILLERQGNNSKWVFPNPKTGKPYTKMDKAFKTCRELAQIKEYIKQHDFGRTAATWMYEEGIDIYTISIILGHSNIKTTRIYIGIKQKTINDAMQSINSHILTEPQTISNSKEKSKGEKMGKIFYFPAKNCKFENKNISSEKLKPAKKEGFSPLINSTLFKN